MAPPIRARMAIQIGEARRYRRTARLSIRSTTQTQTEPLAPPRARMETATPPQTATPIRTPAAAGRVPVAPAPMPHTATETAAGFLEVWPITTARRHSAAGAATPLTAPVGAGVHARRVRAAGAAEAAALVVATASA